MCADRGRGGGTPSFGLVQQLVRCYGDDMNVNVLIRPRAGDFVYTEREMDVISRDVLAARAAGADGVVLGVLTADGCVDVPKMSRLRRLAGDMMVTFHRAFDVTSDPYTSLQAVLQVGCDRLLTSGQAPSALEGTGMLASLRQWADELLSSSSSSSASVSTTTSDSGHTPTKAFAIVAAAGVCTEFATHIVNAGQVDGVHAGSAVHHMVTSDADATVNVRENYVNTSSNGTDNDADKSSNEEVDAAFDDDVSGGTSTSDNAEKSDIGTHHPGPGSRPASRASTSTVVTCDDQNYENGSGHRNTNAIGIMNDSGNGSEEVSPLRLDTDGPCTYESRCARVGDKSWRMRAAAPEQFSHTAVSEQLCRMLVLSASLAFLTRQLLLRVSDCGTAINAAEGAADAKHTLSDDALRAVVASHFPSTFVEACLARIPTVPDGVGGAELVELEKALVVRAAQVVAALTTVRDIPDVRAVVTLQMTLLENTD